MIDPIKISNFNLTSEELEENILFWITAAGKNGVTSARLLNDLFYRLKFILDLEEITSSFDTIRKVPTVEILRETMKITGIGNHKAKSRGFWEIVHSNIDLKTCTYNDLIKIHSIGPKTAKAFLVHTRPNQRFAVIDTHLLKFLRDQGIMVPKSTPPEGKRYNELEKAYLNICDSYSIDIASLDLAVWNHYRSTPNLPFDLEKYANDYHQSSICADCNGRG